jgi:hypothetical protein
MSRLFRIQYVSDLHLEFYEKIAFPLLVKPISKYLALAGSIGHPNTPVWNSFFQYVSSNWEHVFYVTGNHEYYNKEKRRWKYITPQTFSKRHNDIAASLSQWSNVHLLDTYKPYFLTKDNVAIVGNTLWSHIPDKDKMFITLSINDYNYIAKEGIIPFSVEDTCNLHNAQKTLLQEKIDYFTFQKIPIVVITHHMPSYTLISPRYKDNASNCAFASNCETMLTPYVRAWIYGRTHNVSNVMIQKTMCLVNARGYPNKYVPGFLNTAFYEFDTSKTLEATDGALEELADAASYNISNEMADEVPSHNYPI